MPVRALVEAGRCFGIGDNSLRVALARLLARGRVERNMRGRYRLMQTLWLPIGPVYRFWTEGYLYARSDLEPV